MPDVERHPMQAPKTWTICHQVQSLEGSLGGAQHCNPREIVVRAVFGALPNGFPKDQLKLSGDVNIVPENTRVWVVAHGDRRVPFEAILARRHAIGAQGALVLAVWIAQALRAVRQPRVYENGKLYEGNDQLWGRRVALEQFFSAGPTAVNIIYTYVRSQIFQERCIVYPRRFGVEFTVCFPINLATTPC